MNTNPIYRQTFLNHLKIGWFLIVYMTIFILLCTGFYISNGSFENKYGESSLILIVVFFCVMFLPAIYLHAEHLIANWGLTAQLSDSDLIITKNKLIQRIPLDFIEEVIIFKARNYDLYKMPHIRYFYGRIVLKDKESIVLTGFLGCKIDWELLQSLKSPIQHRRFFFSTIFLRWKD